MKNSANSSHPKEANQVSGWGLRDYLIYAVSGIEQEALNRQEYPCR